MATGGTFTNNGDGTTTLLLEWTYDTTKLQNLAGDFAEYLFNTGWRAPTSPATSFDQWTNQDKVDLIHHYVDTDGNNKARANYVSSAAEAATETAEQEADTRY